jgi:hypothetical protein
MTLYATYILGEPDDHRALAVHLQQNEGSTRPVHEIVQELDNAMVSWEETVDVFVDSDLSVKPGVGAVRQTLSDYLYADGTVNGQRLMRHLAMVLEDGRIHTHILRPGQAVDGRDLVGRQADLEALRNHLHRGSVHLKAPRRYGKTSVLRQLKKELDAAGEACLYIEVSPEPTAAWFLASLVAEAMEGPHCRAALCAIEELADWPDIGANPRQKSLASREFADRLGSNVRNLGQRILEALGASGAILLVDEFSVFLRSALGKHREDMEMISEILAASRRSENPVRQVLAGSAGLNVFLNFYELKEQFKDLKDVALGPLEREWAMVLAEELLYGAHHIPTAEVVDEILTQVGAPVPFFIHELVHVICERVDEEVTVEAVRQAYRDGLLGSRGRDTFKAYKLVGQGYPEDLVKPAAFLLRELARVPDGLSKDHLQKLYVKAGAEASKFPLLLSCLQEDYDLVKQDGNWLIRSKVLRDRWSLEEPWMTTGGT